MAEPNPTILVIKYIRANYAKDENLWPLAEIAEYIKPYINYMTANYKPDDSVSVQKIGDYIMAENKLSQYFVGLPEDEDFDEECDDDDIHEEDEEDNDE